MELTDTCMSMIHVLFSEVVVVSSGGGGTWLKEVVGVVVLGEDE